MRRVLLAFTAASAIIACPFLSAAAADIASMPDAVASPTDGVACGDPVVQSFPSVWQGRFQGGFSHYVGEGGPVIVDWRQERLCFPDRGSCRRYVSEMCRDFHRPEGYFTCLPIR